MEELKLMKQWVCWNYKLVDGEMKKVPCTVYGINTGCDEPHRWAWVTFDQASAARDKNGFDGVSLVVPENYFFLDIDAL